MEDKHLDITGLSFFWSKLKKMLAGKQDKLTGSAGQFIRIDTDGNPVAMDAEKSVSFTVTLEAADWSEKEQTVSDTRFIKEGYAYIVTPAPVNFVAYGDAGIYAEDVLTDGQMIFHCESAPPVALNVHIVRMVVM